MADKIDSTAIGRRAHRLAAAEVRSGDPVGGPTYDEVFYKHFARLVMEECAVIAERTSRVYMVDVREKIAETIRARMP